MSRNGADASDSSIPSSPVIGANSHSILGTTLCTEVVTEEVELGTEPAGVTVALGLPGKYLRAFPTFAGGELVSWA
jgi:xylulokinase